MCTNKNNTRTYTRTHIRAHARTQTHNQIGKEKERWKKQTNVVQYNSFVYTVRYTPTQTPSPSSPSSSPHNISFFHSRAFAQFIRVFKLKLLDVFFRKKKSIQSQKKCGKTKSTQTRINNLKTNYCYPMYIIIASGLQVLDAEMHRCDASMKEIHKILSSSFGADPL